MLAFGAAAVLAGSVPAPAQAEVWYPWCATYSGGERGLGTTVCSFSTQEQCMASVRGLGGFCSPNPAPAPSPPPRSRARK
jgi:hypothetical protein